MIIATKEFPQKEKTLRLLSIIKDHHKTLAPRKIKQNIKCSINTLYKRLGKMAPLQPG